MKTDYKKYKEECDKLFKKYVKDKDGFVHELETKNKIRYSSRKLKLVMDLFERLSSFLDRKDYLRYQSYNEGDEDYEEFENKDEENIEV